MSKQPFVSAGLLCCQMFSSNFASPDLNDVQKFSFLSVSSFTASLWKLILLWWENKLGGKEDSDQQENPLQLEFWTCWSALPNREPWL